VGGRAAAAVGRRLAVLAATRQVVVVTHLAQIAAHADRHFVVVKDGGAATVERLPDEERPAELARMLSGDVTDVSLAHARDLIETGRPG
jgi:DNA repair protein RecN (Recombination protein N)